MRPFPIAGQSPGNQAFADWFRTSFPNQPLRWINRLDVCPMMFGEMDAITRAWAGGPQCPLAIQIAIDALWKDFVGYVSLRDPYVFPGQLYPSDPHDAYPWETQTTRQHQHLYYLWMAGVPLAVINRSFLPLQLALPPGQLDSKID